MIFSINKYIVFFLITLMSLSCSTPRPKGKTEAEVLYKEALSLVKDNRYLLASEKLNSIRSKFPYSYFATHAELLQADIFFKQENYVESAAAYILFRDFHPKHKKMGYVVWRIAESFYFQLPDTFDRDLTSGHESIKYYKELLRRFPGSEYSKDAREKINLCENMIKQKEKYIADFYFKTKVYDSARYRYLNLLKQFNDESLKTHSMLRILKSSYRLKDYKACVSYYDTYKLAVKNKFKAELDKTFNECKALSRGGKS